MTTPYPNHYMCMWTELTLPFIKLFLVTSYIMPSIFRASCPLAVFHGSIIMLLAKYIVVLLNIGTAAAGG